VPALTLRKFQRHSTTACMLKVISCTARVPCAVMPPWPISVA
jgi:hypothetical protein